MVVRVNGSTGIVTVSGTSGAPSLRGPDGNSGISFDGDQVIISSSGLVAATFSDSAATINNLSVDTTTLEFSPGSSGTPTVAPSGDLNTGIYFPAADTIGFAEGGNEAARIDDSGRVLINTNTARANFNNSTDTTRFQVEGIDAATSSISLVCNNGGGVPVASIHLAKSDGSAVGSNGAVGNNWNIGDIRFSGNDGTQFVEAARIEAEIDGTPGADDMPARLVFSTTADGASSPTGRMSITRAGTVSIPALSASNLFDTPRLAIEGDNTNESAYFRQATTSSIRHIEFRNGNGVVGNISTDGSTTSYNGTSDYRLKENVTPISDGITRLQQLKPSRFNFVADPDKTVDGFLAHEAQTVVPEAVIGTKDEVKVWKESEDLPDGVSVGDNKLDKEGNTIPVYQGIDLSKFVPLLTAALQEAIGKIEALETANASQAATIAALDARLASLESA